MNRKRQDAFFLEELARSNKPLLGLIIAWLSFAAFSAWTKFEGTPVHMWNMFAVPLPEQKRYTVTVLYADGKPVGDPAPWHYFCNMVATHSSAHYLRLTAGTYNPPEFRSIKRIGAAIGLDLEGPMAQLLPTAETVNAYPAWLKRYTANTLGRRVDTLKLVAYDLAYNESGRLHLLSSRTIFIQ